MVKNGSTYVPQDFIQVVFGFTSSLDSQTSKFSIKIKSLPNYFSDSFRIDYLDNGCKLVTDGENRRLLLVPEGKTAPINVKADATISIPLKNVFAASSTQVGPLLELGVLSSLKAVISINGRKTDRNLTMMKAKIGVVPQHMNLEGELTAWQNLELHGCLYGLEKKIRRERIEELLKFTDLSDRAKHHKTFEEFMIAPVNMLVFTVAKITAGALRGIYSALIIILISLIFNAGLFISPYFVLILLLNCLVFSALGFTAGIVIDSHADMGKFTNFVITPMSFLCGTFFPLDRMPVGLKEFIWLLPLTHTSLGLRSSGEDALNMLSHPLILMLYFIVLQIINNLYNKHKSSLTSRVN